MVTLLKRQSEERHLVPPMTDMSLAMSGLAMFLLLPRGDWSSETLPMRRLGFRTGLVPTQFLQNSSGHKPRI